MDGFDLDIQQGSSTGYSALAKRLKDKGTMITGAIGSDYPDPYLGDAVDKVNFDTVSVRNYDHSNYRLAKRQMAAR